jgi:hypothetical protein
VSPRRTPHETNVTNVVDPLGGTVAAIEAGYFQQAQADFAYEVAQCRPPSRR